MVFRYPVSTSASVGLEYADERRNATVAASASTEGDAAVHAASQKGRATPRGAAYPDWFLEAGTMHLFYWFMDFIEGFVPLIRIGMEG